MGLHTEQMKKDLETSKAGGESLYWRPEEGKRNIIRLLPRSMKFFTKEGDTGIAYPYYVHYNLFAVDGYKRIICKQSFGVKCPVCDYAASFDDKKKAKNLRASAVFMFNIFEYESAKIRIFEAGKYIYETICEFVVDPSWGESLLDIKAGRDIVIEKEVIPQNRKGLENPYKVKPLPDKTDISELLGDKWDESIDSLQDRRPEQKDDAYYLMLVEHLRNGTTPPPIVRDQGNNKQQGQPAAAQAQPQAQAAPAAAKAEPAPAAPPVEKPKCFGLEYSPRLEKCKACPVKGDCRETTLKL